VILLSTLLFSSALWAGMNLKLFPVVFGLESKEQFYGSLKEHNLYDASNFINEKTPIGAKIFLLKDGRGYFIERDLVMDNYFHTTYFRRFTTDGELLQKLKQLNITHILINHNFDDDPDRKAIYTPDINKLFSNLITKYAEKIYDKKGIEIFELK